MYSKIATARQSDEYSLQTHSSGSASVGAERSDHGESHFRDLKAFLGCDSASRRSYSAATSNLAVLHSGSKGGQQLTRSLQNVDECIDLIERGQSSEHSRVLFLTGYPAPHWIAKLRDRFALDPEFLRRHLCYGKDELFSSPPLPSASDNIITLSLTSTEWHGSRSAYTQKHVNDLRRQTADDVKLYTHQLRRGAWQGYGRSVIRQRHIHDSEYSSVEQELTICVKRWNSTWIAIIMSDVGQDGNDNHMSASVGYEANSTCPVPVAATSIASTSIPSLNSVHKDVDLLQAPTSAALLQLQYNKELDAGISRDSPFLALSGLLNFVAASGHTFLGRISSVLDAEIRSDVLESTIPTLSNVLYHQAILEAHLISFQRMLAIIRRRGGASWPQPSEPAEQASLEAVALRLQDDYSAIIARCESLVAKCERGVALIMHQTTLLQSQRSNAQSEAVTKLTKLAFLFAPLTLTTGVFGMNVDEVLREQRSVWAWVLFSLPVVFFTLLLLACDIPAMLHWGFEILKISVRRLKRCMGY